MTAKVLLIDIETSPNIAYVWGAWKQNVGSNQWIEKTHIMSFAAKWLDEEEVMYEENRTSNDKKIIREIYNLLDEADVVVAHNGDGFDLPTILGRGVAHSYVPPSPYHVVDTLKIAKRRFRFPQNSLAFLCEHLNLPRKLDHKKYPGFKLWLGCLRGEDEAWEEMKEYNIHDVISLEALYKLFLPYINNHPNIARPDEDGEVCCPKCGGDDVQWRGYYHTKAGLSYHKFQCMDCGGWGRVKTSAKDNPDNYGRNAM